MNTPTQQNYDRLSRWYDLFSASERKLTRLGIRTLAPTPGETLLEIGAGTGHGLVEMSAAAQGAGRIIGLDLSSGMLRRARFNLAHNRVAGSINLLQADALALPFTAGCFDAILLSFTLELFPETDIPRLLAGCHAALKPGGRLGVIALEACTPPGLVERIYTRLHHLWPQVIDCRPIPVAQHVRQSHFSVRQEKHLTLWGIPVAIVIAEKPQTG